MALITPSGVAPIETCGLRTLASRTLLIKQGGSIRSFSHLFQCRCRHGSLLIIDVYSFYFFNLPAMEYHKRLNLVAATCLCLAAAATACYVESSKFQNLL
jgi:hypothetical protein